MEDRKTGSSATPARPRSDVSIRSKHHHTWLIVATLVAVGGMISAVVAAGSVARTDADKSRRGFEQASGEVASTLELAIHDEESLVVNASAFVLDRTDTTNTEFLRWLSNVRAFERYPELRSVGDAVIVPASELAAFAERAKADPTSILAADGSFEVTPAGDRPYYCFSSLGRGADTSLDLPSGFDFCADPSTDAAIAIARDSGESSYGPVKIADGVTWLAVYAPVYQGGVTPETVEARRAEFFKIFAVLLDPSLVLDRALQGHPGMAASMRYDLNSSNVEFTSGMAPTGAEAFAIDLHNGWTITTVGNVASSSVVDNENAMALLAAGVLLSAVLALLVLVLATGRTRALSLVGEKTGELRHQALHDALTGLPNRALIMDRIEQLLVRTRRTHAESAALFIDLDEFKNVNDTLGHAAGDRLLLAVAARLESTLRNADTIGRMGGDEFVVLIDGATGIAPELVAERLLDVMRQPFELEGASMPLMVNVSIGIAVGDRATGGDLLRDADVALYQAKAAGKNRYEVFDTEMQTEVSHRVEIEFDLRSALQGDQFRLVYQPIYNLDDLSLAGVEALIRWEHPTRGTLQPDDFIPILEQTGEIREVGRWVLTEACTQMAAWHARGDTLDISVNVSGRQLDTDAIVDHIREALEVSGLDASSLIIEVTETALMRNAHDTARRLQAIKSLGVRIAVDDFGTGYSSLAYLQQFPVDCLKIDRMFTNAITSSPESRALIGTLVQLGKDLGLKTLAEGVETTDEMDHLRAEHVDEAQGFLLARPLDPLTFETQLLIPARPTDQQIPQP
jgi:diguanylate cyclase (GGDEF)-like protein